MEAWPIVPLVLLLVTVSTVGGAWVMTRWVAVVERWSERNGYRIIRQDFRAVLRRPFSYRPLHDYATVYRMTVQDQTGKHKSGWILFVGDSILGCLLSDRVDEVWDDPA